MQGQRLQIGATPIEPFVSLSGDRYLDTMYTHILLSNATPNLIFICITELHVNGYPLFLLVHSIIHLSIHSIITAIFSHGLYPACYASLALVSLSFCAPSISSLLDSSGICVLPSYRTHLASIYLHSRYYRNLLHLKCG